MKYNPSTSAIPQEAREDINSKILSIIESGTLPEGITHEDIYNGYTGVGGLHGLNRDDYSSYHKYAEDKKEIEQGQFFTPGQVVDDIAKLLDVQDNDLIIDPTCGAGAFFNSFKEHQCYGCDIDMRAVKVAKYLYPNANIETKDIRYLESDIKFDYVVGNPPFNLRWDYKDGERHPSQMIYCMKAAEILKPGGIMICIVPDSFLKDMFFCKGMIDTMNESFNFLFQYNLVPQAFKSMGVQHFETKVIAFQRKAKSLPDAPYDGKYYNYDQAKVIMHVVSEAKHKLKAKFRSELMESMNSYFGYKVKKYLYEFKQHKKMQPYLAKANAYLERFQTQKKPDDMKWEEWDKVKITENKVLAYFRDIMKKQSAKPVDSYRLVQTKYGFKYKAYSDKAQALLSKVHKRKVYNYNDLMFTPGGELRDVVNFNIEGVKPWMQKLIEKKRKQIELQITPFEQMGRNEKVDTFLNRFVFLNPKGDKCKFNEFQKKDLGYALQKPYSILNWQQGSGKTAGATSWLAYIKNRNTFIIGPALAINTTWQKHLTIHNKPYINVRSYKDVQAIKPGMFVLIGLEMLVKYERHIKRYIKHQCQKVNVVFDESDEITNNLSKRTRATLNCFRRVKRKLLTTGTTTRNNINEIYSQLELLYNNSASMMCWCPRIWREEKEGLKEVSNDRYGEPFPPYYGQMLFKRCFNPAKSTVFGIQKHNQDLYNEQQLKDILAYTIQTRKFREIAGDKYFITNVKVNQHEGEKAAYKMIIKELNKVLPLFYNGTGNSRKDAMLRIIQQLQLLIKATSMPQNFPGYNSSKEPTKLDKITEMVGEYDKKIAVGCTSREATEYYTEHFRSAFPGRPVFMVDGDVSFKGRDDIRKVFESTTNGILVCTQQSLKSSVNIPSCSKVIIESLQWNIPKIEQFFFRFIRYDSPNVCEVVFINYENTIEMNLMALLMSKERLNDYIKTLEYRDNSDVYEEYGIDLDILNSILTKEVDDEGHMQISWGKAEAI